MHEHGRVVFDLKGYLVIPGVLSEAEVRELQEFVLRQRSEPESLPPHQRSLPGGLAERSIDHPAVMGSRERLWSIYGDAWGWPPADMTVDQDRADLARHAEEMRRGESFNFGVFDADEAELFGCVYIDPPSDDDDADAVVSWWVVDAAVGSPLDRALRDGVPRWLATEWPFARVRYGV